MNFSLALPAFIAGALTFLAPCTLPLVPAYLGFISGVSFEDLSASEKILKARTKIVLNGAFFVLGFTLVFIAFGTLAGVAGTTIGHYRLWLNRFGGLIVITFGLSMLNILKLPSFNTASVLKIPDPLQRGKPLSSLLLGFSFGLGWTPCVGPIVGSILLLASTSQTALQGALMLAIFSLGLALPFLLVALGIGTASQYIKKGSRYFQFTSLIGGIFLIGLGILLLTSGTGLLTAYGYRLLQFMNYNRLLNYL